MAKLLPGTSQGDVQSSKSTEFDPDEGGTPHTGFDEAPKAEVRCGSAGPGVGNSRRGIH